MSLFFFDFRSPWALHGMSSYAIRTRLRSPNTLFRFRSFSEKNFQRSSFWSQIVTTIELKNVIFMKKKVSENGLKKGAPPNAN